MNLDRGFTGSDLGGYLFVEQTGYHKRQDFTLPRCQQFETLADHRDLSLTAPPGTVLFQRDLNRIQQVLVAERLGQELDGSRFHGSHRHGDVAVAGDKDDGNMNTSLSQLALKI